MALIGVFVIFLYILKYLIATSLSVSKYFQWAVWQNNRVPETGIRIDIDFWFWSASGSKNCFTWTKPCCPSPFMSPWPRSMIEFGMLASVHEKIASHCDRRISHFCFWLTFWKSSSKEMGIISINLWSTYAYLNHSIVSIWF